MTQSQIIVLAASPLILWRICKRVQRLTVRQQSRLWRHWFGVSFLPLARVYASGLLRWRLAGARDKAA